ncbi:MAG TPA: AI-2E family transporter [Chloroflexota bacterium]
MTIELAGIVLILAALHVAAPIFNPIFLAVVLALIFWPLYVQLRARKIATPLALTLMLIGMLVAGGLLAALMAYSVNGLIARLDTYAANWSAKMEQLDAWLHGLGFTGADLASSLSPQDLGALLAGLVGGLASFLTQAALVLLLMLFFLGEGGAIVGRLRAALGEGSTGLQTLTGYGRDVSRYFALRAAVNAATGVGVALVLLLLGVDFPLLWGVLTFFLSFVPYVGMFLASVPSVLLAFAEFDLTRALIVIVALTVVNALAENLLQPMLMSRGLHLSPTFVFTSVVFWTFLLGGPGAFLAVPLLLGMVAIAASFGSTRWLAAVAADK